jgi:hypothetical protein
MCTNGDGQSIKMNTPRTAARNELSHDITIQADALLQHTVLPQYKMDWRTFAELMSRTDARVGGSVALGCLVGSQWNNTLDLYVHSDRAYAMWEGYLIAKGWSHAPRRETSMPSAPPTEVGVRMTHPRFRGILDSVYTFTNTENLIVNRIKIYVCNIAEFISEIDLACCTATARVRQTSHGEYMTVWTCDQNEDMLRRKVSYIQTSHLTPQEQLRVEKYRERGFVITEMTTAYPPTHGALVRCGPPPTISNSPIVVGAPPPYVPQLFRL